MLPNDLNARIENSKQPDFGVVLTKSFELFQKVWIEGFVHLLLTMILIVPITLIVYLVFMGWAAGGDFMYEVGVYRDLMPQDPPASVIIFTIFIFVILMIFSQVLAMAISAHFLRICQKADTGVPIDTGGYFIYLKEAGVVKLLMLSLATLGIAILATLLCYLPLFYVMVPLNLVTAILAFYPQLSTGEIIQAAFKLGNRHWLIFFGLLIVGGLIAQLGLLACLIGVFFTASFSQIVLYYMFKESVGDSLLSDEITSHL